MHRCSSDSSLLNMSRPLKGFEKFQSFTPDESEMGYRPPFSFDPMDSDSYEYFGIPSQESIYIPDAQPLPPGAREPAYIDHESQSSDSETYSEYPEPVTQTDPTAEAIHITDLKNARETLAALSSYSGGQIGQYLKSHKGLLILPLHALSVLRVPNGRHTGNYPLLIYYPKEGIENYPDLHDFNLAVETLYP